MNLRPRRRVVQLGTLLLLAGATVPHEYPASAAPVPPPGAAAFDTLFTAGSGPVHRQAFPGWDAGVGFVRLASSFEPPPGHGPSSVVELRAEPAPDAPLVARVHFLPWEVVVESFEPGLTSGAMEVDYEELALPVTEIDPGGGWIRAAYALAPDGTSRAGWAATDRAGIDVRLWSEWLPAWGVLFFADPERIAFFDAPEGEPVSLALDTGMGSQEFDYILHTLRTDGPWMKVEVASPSDYCEAEESSRRRAWIRYLDDAGRPDVWYFTRGC